MTQNSSFQISKHFFRDLFSETSGKRRCFGASGYYLAALVAVLSLVPAAGAFAQAPSGAEGEEPELLKPADRTQKETPRKFNILESGTLGFGAAAGEGVDEGLHASTIGFFEIDNTGKSIYFNERTLISYKGMTLEADQMHIDMDLFEAEASGNVILTGLNIHLAVEKLVFNFREKTGEGYKVVGTYESLRIRHAEDETDLPSFRRISEHESVFTKTSLTVCKFSKPHYRLKAREILFYHGDKVMLKGVTLHIEGIPFPVFYLPVYSKSFKEGSPWLVRGGIKSRIGAWGRLGYQFKHSTEEPSLTDDEVMRIKNEGAATFFADYFSKRGAGTGLLYEYSFDYNRHWGELDLYYLKDNNREVTYPTREEELNRFRIGLKHRSQLTENLVWTANSDYFSDPEIYDEILDLFNEYERERVMERSARTALTYVREQMAARLAVDLKDRIGRDRFSNFSIPGDDDRDFDEQPDIPYKKRDDEGIHSDRWGRASIRAPQATLSTAWLPLFDLPLYYHTDLNIFNNLDRGLNLVDADDNAFVRGFDWYHALMWRLRLGKRSTLLTKLGVGGGMAMREDDTFGYGDDMEANFGGASPVFPLDLYPLKRKSSDLEGGYGNMTFLDSETFVIGTEPFNLKDDVNDSFVYGDALVRFQSRLSNALIFNVIYKYRKTTDDFLGDWYARMGHRFVRDDLYNFRLREHYVQTLLTYFLADPNLRVSLSTFNNLIGEGELYPNEVKNAYGVTGQWTNRDQTLSLASRVGLYETQMFHHSDPAAYVDSSFRWYVYANYQPRSQRWWAHASTSFRERLDHSLSTSLRHRRYTEDENEFVLRGLLGGRIGPKWTAQIGGDWNSRIGSFREVTLGFQRDLHDALLLLAVTLENDLYRDDVDDNNFANQLDFRFAFQPKMPGAIMREAGGSGITVIKAKPKKPEVSTTDFF